MTQIFRKLLRRDESDLGAKPALEASAPIEKASAATDSAAPREVHPLFFSSSRWHCSR